MDPNIKAKQIHVFHRVAKGTRELIPPPHGDHPDAVCHHRQTKAIPDTPRPRSEAPGTPSRYGPEAIGDPEAGNRIRPGTGTRGSALACGTLVSLLACVRGIAPLRPVHMIGEGGDRRGARCRYCFSMASAILSKITICPRCSPTHPRRSQSPNVRPTDSRVEPVSEANFWCVVGTSPALSACNRT